ncbi:2-amino-4-hydroxy-6-hydroxymethyldihydropteridine diphosphokinase [Sandaracinomonas limnophila]|uniref:2-amino-4-hydroxy-6-hydroxymethyldihydropteridine pyrophosphokinase n=2 Tax=Sandaracinomonas limnophila TaxID=1862386 RepID=A0A437PS41_9BACT|nr:2-amino-4-hydroxy-6-hydroxymethyldihydropteridine diphosphokinase [Sandaracinomonas limnophila]
MNMSHLAYISLGGNIGNTLEIFQNALLAIEKKLGKIIQKSSIYQTAAWGKEDQNDFLNQVILIETSFDAKKLLDSLLTIELLFERKRIERWGPRTLDLDLLSFDNQIENSESLVLPHPRIQERKFILVPLAELNPNWVHPMLRKSVSELLDNCADQLKVKRIS